jgi:hypothetical protein
MPVGFCSPSYRERPIWEHALTSALLSTSHLMTEPVLYVFPKE